MLSRRTFLGAVGTGAALTGLANEVRIAMAQGPAESSREQPWLLRTEEVPITGQRTVWDARTGEDVGCRVPYTMARRLERSRLTGQPVRIVLFRLKEGKTFIGGGRLVTEPAWVRVIA